MNVKKIEKFWQNVFFWLGVIGLVFWLFLEYCPKILPKPLIIAMFVLQVCACCIMMFGIFLNGLCGIILKLFKK